MHPSELLTGLRGVLDPDVIGPVVGEFPTQRGTVEGLCLFEVVNRKFDVIDHVSHGRRLSAEGQQAKGELDARYVRADRTEGDRRTVEFLALRREIDRRLPVVHGRSEL